MAEMTKKEAKKWVVRLKRKLGPEKYGELAALLLDRKLAGTSPQRVVDEVRDKFEIDVHPDFVPVFIKY